MRYTQGGIRYERLHNFRNYARQYLCGLQTVWAKCGQNVGNWKTGDVTEALTWLGRKETEHYLCFGTDRRAIPNHRIGHAENAVTNFMVAQR